MRESAAGPVIELRRQLKDRFPLAFGVSGPLGGKLFTAREVADLVRLARDEGISIFDTGPFYGAGEAERRLGAALHGDEGAFVMTKAGVEASGALKRTRDFSPTAIAQSVERSLTRLNRDRIDLLWLHGSDRSELTDDLFFEFERLTNAGKVGAIGIAARDLAMARFASTPPFAARMTPVTNTVEPSSAPKNEVIFGIEGLSNIGASSRLSFTRSGLWKLARRLVRGRQSPISVHSVEDAIRFAFDGDRCDVLVMATTRRSHLLENSSICRAVTEKDS